jgi:hypothetical protein
LLQQRVPLASKIVITAGLPVVLVLGATGAGIRSLAATDATTRRVLRRVVQLLSGWAALHVMRALRRLAWASEHLLHRAARIGEARQGALAHAAPAAIAFAPPALLVDRTRTEEHS